MAKTLHEKTKLLVIGNGMVSARFCESLVKHGVTLKHAVSVVGNEPRIAYNRVKLSTYVEHRDANKLTIFPKSWYDENNIAVHTGEKVVAVDTTEKFVKTSSGETHRFDTLVFATGSRPFTPPIPGMELPTTLVYRTIEDLENIIDQAKTCKRAAVIGGGLLGLEAAHGLKELGIGEVHVIEMATLLLPRQLNKPASELLEAEVERQGYKVRLGAVTRSIEALQEGGCRIQFDDYHLDVDMVVVSAGIRPNSELAKDAGIDCGTPGGIIVDRRLETSCRGVFAIGECALSQGRIYGLVAPGYQMAETLAANLAQPGHSRKRQVFESPDLSTKLKMIGVDVTLLGEYLQPGRTIEYGNGEVYRALSFDVSGKLTGAVAVGDWPQASLIQDWISKGRKLRDKVEQQFRETGMAGASVPPPVTSWPDAALVCNCLKISAGNLRTCVAGGASDAVALARQTGASTVCGSCAPLLETLAGNVAPAETISRPVWLPGLSVAALVVALLAVIYKGPPTPESVESFGFKLSQLWRDSFYKQVSGYTLLGISTVGLLFSLRKRIPFFTIGKFASWRLFHVFFGLTALFGLFAHTGFRFGHNLNFWLMFTFVGLNILGAGAGVVSALEADTTSRIGVIARRCRRPLILSHIILFWPFPILLTFHVLSVYFY